MPSVESKLFINIDEAPEPTKAKVTGEVPSWLKGTLLRNGTGMFEIGPDRYNHWFDGLALMQRFHIENGEVWCNTRYLRSKSYQRNMAANRIVCSEFGTLGHPDPCKTLFNRYFSYFFPHEITDNDSVNFLQSGDEVYASTETAILHKVDPKTLETQDRVNMRKYVAINTCTAHAHYDREGNMYNLGTSNGGYSIVFVPKAQEDKDRLLSGSKVLHTITPISKLYPSYYHSFAMSENYIVFPEMPLLLSVPKLMTTAFVGNSYRDCMSWEKDQEVKFHVISKKDNKPVELQYIAGPMFAFHHANTYEENGCLIMDCSAHLDGSVVMQLSSTHDVDDSIHEAYNAGVGLFFRYVLPIELPENVEIGQNILASMDVKTDAEAILQADGKIFCKPEKMIDDVCFEFPRYNYEMCNMRKYRYLYGTELPAHGPVGSRVFKMDINTRSYKAWARENDTQLIGEPVFVGRPGATEEDDGIVLVPVADRTTDMTKDFLLIIDAKEFEVLARCEVDPRLPMSFHAHYVDGV